MAVRQVIVSDISGADIPDDAHARIVITDHPGLRGSPVELDVSLSEAERFQTSKIDLVTMEIHAPGQPRRHVALEAGALRSLFPDTDLDGVIGRARAVPDSNPAAARRVGRGGGRRAKVDYASADHAGSLHRGRVTEAEAAYVRAHLDEVNARLASNGERVIDPNDPKEKHRYGL
ncbi:MAG: hypothetical protein ACK5OX_08855 [Desertimonas sp.]